MSEWGKWRGGGFGQCLKRKAYFLWMSSLRLNDSMLQLPNCDLMTCQNCCLKPHTSSESAPISVEHAASENIFTLIPSSPPPPPPLSSSLPSASWLFFHQTPTFLWLLGLHKANRRSLWAEKADSL